MTDEINAGIDASEGEAVETADLQPNVEVAPEADKAEAGQDKAEPTTEDIETEGETSQKSKQELEAQEERTRRLREHKRRLAEIEKEQSEIKDPSIDEYEDPDRRVADMAANAAWLKQLEADKRRQTMEIEALEREEAHRYMAKADKAEREARERYTDFDAKLSTLSAIVGQDQNPAITTALRESDRPADLAYYLGNNPDLASRLNRLEPLAAAREIGRIEAGLAPPKPRTKTQAQAPITPLKGGGNTDVKDPEDMSFAEYEAARKAGKL